MSATITHGRHCACSACAREDWTKIDAPCGMHGPDCSPVYAPLTRCRARDRPTGLRCNLPDGHTGPHNILPREQERMAAAG